MFFFEKKNQKTSGYLLPRLGQHGAKSQKFFASFFQKRRASLLTLAACLCSPARGDDMGKFNAALWHIPAWTPDGATFAGRTQFRVAQGSSLPGVAQVHVVLGVQSYNPTGAAFLGDELISNRALAVGLGIDISYRARMDAGARCGVVGGLFLYAQKAGGLHDKIDFELLTNLPGQVQTNIYGNEPLGVGRPLLVALPTGMISNEHVYEINWSAAKVSWLVDGRTMRSVTAGVPAGPVSVYLNAWAPAADWRSAYCADIQPARSAERDVRVGNMAVGDVRVRPLP